MHRYALILTILGIIQIAVLSLLISIPIYYQKKVQQYGIPIFTLPSLKIRHDKKRKSRTTSSAIFSTKTTLSAKTTSNSIISTKSTGAPSETLYSPTYDSTSKRVSYKNNLTLDHSTEFKILNNPVFHRILAIANTGLISNQGCNF